MMFSFLVLCKVAAAQELEFGRYYTQKKQWEIYTVVMGVNEEQVLGVEFAGQSQDIGLVLVKQGAPPAVSYTNDVLNPDCDYMDAESWFYKSNKHVVYLERQYLEQNQPLYLMIVNTSFQPDTFDSLQYKITLNSSNLHLDFCKTDEDCTYNGFCINGYCQCNIFYLGHFCNIKTSQIKTDVGHAFSLSKHQVRTFQILQSNSDLSCIISSSEGDFSVYYSELSHT